MVWEYRLRQHAQLSVLFLKYKGLDKGLDTGEKRAAFNSQSRQSVSSNHILNFTPPLSSGGALQDMMLSKQHCVLACCQ